MKEKLEILEKQIRKDLPRLMEVKEGVLLRDKITNQILKIIYIEKDRFSFVNIKTGNVSSDNLVKNIDEDFEIIGHDILLTDVLEWLEAMGHKTSIHGRKEFVIFCKKGEYTFNRYSTYLDLSKPRLADQSEELWNFLYNLIKED